MNVVAAYRAILGAWSHPEQLVQRLRLDFLPSVGAAAGLLGRAVVWDPSLPPEEAAKQLARACARYIIQEGARCSEDALTAEILRGSRARTLSRDRLARRLLQRTCVV